MITELTTVTTLALLMLASYSLATLIIALGIKSIGSNLSKKEQQKHK